MKNLKIGWRLGLGFGMVILLIGIIIVIAMFRMGGAEKHVNNILEDRYRKIALMSQVKYNVALIHQHMRAAVIEGDAEGVRKETAVMDALRAKNKEMLDAFEKTLNTAQGREIFAEILKMRANDVAVQKELLALLSSGSQQEAKELLKSRAMQAEQAYVKRMSEIIDLQTQKMAEESAFMRDEFYESRIEFVILAIAALACSLFAAVYVTRGITIPMKEAVDVARRVAQGDLNVDIAVRSHDETGELLQALKEMTEALANIVGEARSSAETISSASQQIASGNADLSSRTEAQAGSLEETASSMEELTPTVKQNADNARQANALAVTASEAMREQASVLAKVVSVFKTRGTPGTSAPRARIVPSTQKPAARASGSGSPLQVKRLAAAGSASRADWDEF